jgi:Uma2 family endonuclease
MTASAGFKEKLYTVEEYLEMEERSLEKHEYYNGKIIKMSGGKPVHNQIAMHIGAELRFALKKTKKKFLIYNSDTKIQIPSENLFVYPDAVVVCERPILYGNRKDVIINPLLIVEVLSKATEQHDKGKKFDYYRTLPSFQEYVLLSQDKPFASVYHRETMDTWRIRDIKEGIIDLQSIGCQINLEDIFEDIIFESEEINQNDI